MKVYNNKELVKEVIQQMAQEFSVGKDLDHPNIVKYKYFIIEYYPKIQEYIVHLIMEYLPGPTL